MVALVSSVTSLLEKALALESLTPTQGLTLLTCTDPLERQLIQTYGDRLRQTLVGETVTYVVNRNINFTNICEQHCHFCAFRRDEGESGAYWLTTEGIQEKVKDAVERGAES